MADKTVLITGTSTGIGAASAIRMAEAGWHVYAGVRKIEDGERVAAEASVGRVTPIILDVIDDGAVARALAQIADEAGSLDGLVNNAGIGIGGPIELLGEDEWRRQLDVNFFSVVSLTRQAMPLIDKAGGRFVHIGSVAGRISAPGLAPYAASKHALEAFNWSLRGELSRNTKMTSSIIEPGEIKTPIWDKAQVMLSDVTTRIEAAGLEQRYGFMIDGQRGFIAEGESKGIDADKVAQAVEHALTAKRPKARYLVGPDAKAIGVISRLPDRLLEPVLRLNEKRTERAGRKLA